MMVKKKEEFFFCSKERLKGVEKIIMALDFIRDDEEGERERESFFPFRNTKRIRYAMPPVDGVGN